MDFIPNITADVGYRPKINVVFPQIEIRAKYYRRLSKFPWN